MSDLIQCASCGYITDAWNPECPRCGRSLGDEAEAGAGTVASAQAAPTGTVYGGSSAEPGAVPYAYASPGDEPKRNPLKIVVPVLLLVTAVCLVAGYYYFVRPVTMQRQSEIDALKAILNNQPDFVADCEGVEGDFTYTGRMARKGDRFLMMVDFPRSILLNDPGRTGKAPINVLITSAPNISIVVPELRAYVEVARGTKDMPKNDPIRDILSYVDATKCDIRDFGTSSVGPYETRMFVISAPDGSRRDAYLEVAPALKNLIVRMDFNDDWTAYDGPLQYTLSNVETDVDESLFRIPSTYTKIER